MSNKEIGEKIYRVCQDRLWEVDGKSSHYVYYLEDFYEMFTEYSHDEIDHSMEIWKETFDMGVRHGDYGLHGVRKIEIKKKR